MSSVSVRMKTAPISSIHLLCRQAEPDAARLTKHLHELCVRQGVRRRDVHGSFDVIAVDQPPNRRDEVLIVNPRHELPAVTGAAAEAVACQPEERVEHASSVRTQRHRRPKRNLPSSIGNGFLEGALPRACDVDAESPGVWCARFVAAENARVLVVRAVVSMRVDRGGARLQPHAWRARRSSRSPVQRRASTTRATAGSPLDSRRCTGS